MRFFLLITTLLITCAFSATSAAKALLEIDVHYLTQRHKSDKHLPVLQRSPANLGLAGLQLAIADSNTTGKFLGYHYNLQTHIIDTIEDLQTVLEQLDHAAIVHHLDDALTTSLYEQTAKQPFILFNAGNYSANLRSHACGDNIFHTAPSDAQLTDALGQWLLKKQLTKVFLITGTQAEDQSYIKALERTFKRFRINVIARKAWTFDMDLRRSIQQDIPLFTQTSRPYDAVVVADPSQVFGYYIPYNTFYPRPVVGTEGLIADSWHPAIEQWGARQLQGRFVDTAQRLMQAQDYNHYIAVRAIAQGVQTIGTLDIPKLTQYLRSEAFSLAAYKGRILSFRSDSGQLRAPIPLFHARGLVSQSPQEGFMHPVTELDTLGLTSNEVCQ